MKKALLCCAVLVLICGSAFADTQLLSNGGFESGVLSPWFVDRNFCGATCQPWIVTTSNPHSGVYSAMDIGNIELRQNFTPTAGSMITDISFWVDSQAGINAFDLFYTDGSDEENVVFSTANQWTFEDVTADVDKSKILSGFSIFGVDPSYTTYVDDASITASSPVPEPSTLATLGGGAMVAWGAIRRRRAR